MLAKKSIRKKILEFLKEQKKTDKFKKSLTIKEKLFALKDFKNAKTVMFYASKEEEVDTRDMIFEALRMGKNIALPVIVGDRLKASMFEEGDKLEIGPYGIRQHVKAHIKPISSESIDLVVVPGVAFDRNGNRLGRGKGYYDRFLESLPDSAKTIGVAFDFQVLEDIPITPTDVPIRKLITN